MNGAPGRAVSSSALWGAGVSVLRPTELCRARRCEFIRTAPLLPPARPNKFGPTTRHCQSPRKAQQMLVLLVQAGAGARIEPGPGAIQRSPVLQLVHCAQHLAGRDRIGIEIAATM